MDLIQRMFVRPEGDAGEAGADLMERHGAAMVLEAVARLSLKVDDQMLEIGFGPGLAIEALCRAVTHGHVTGVDPSALMHRRTASRNATAISQRRVTLIEGVAGSLPFADGSFDAALAIDNFHFWPDRVAGLLELRRVLRTDAKFLCAFTPPSGAMRSGIADLFKEVGYLNVVQSESATGFTVMGRNPSGLPKKTSTSKFNQE